MLVQMYVDNVIVLLCQKDLTLDILPKEFLK